MNIMLVILGFQVGAAYFPLPEPIGLPGFTSRERCAAAALELAPEMLLISRNVIPASVQLPRMRWGCVRLDDAVR